MAVVLLALVVVRLLHLLPCFFLLLFTSISLKEEPTAKLVLCAQNFTNLQTKNRTPKNSHYSKRRKEIRKSSRKPRGSKPQTTLPPRPHKHLYQRDSKGKNRKQIEKLVHKNEQNSLLRSETRVAIIRGPALLSKVLSSSLKKSYLTLQQLENPESCSGYVMHALFYSPRPTWRLRNLKVSVKIWKKEQKQKQAVVPTKV